MKILQIIPEFGIAGAEIMLENLIYGLIDKGHQVRVLSLYTYSSPITERLDNHKVDIHYLDKKPGFDIKTIIRLKKEITSFAPDVIHTHRYILPYVCAASFFNRKIIRVHTVHNIATKEVGKKQLLIQKFLVKCLNITLVAISPLIKQTIVDYYKLPSKRVPMVFNGIDLSKCKKKLDYHIGSQCTVIHIGRFSEQKNHKSLIIAFARLCKEFPDIKLKLVGDGELRENIESLVEKYKIKENVKFLGLLGTVYDELYNSDIFILPSNYEGMPITLIESMATGLPIIATNVGGIPDMINNDTSGIIINNTIDDIYNSLKTVINNYELRNKIGQNAQKRSIMFSKENMTQGYIKIYELL